MVDSYFFWLTSDYDYDVWWCIMIWVIVLFFFECWTSKKPNGVFATSRGVFATSRHVGTRRPMSPVDPGTCFDFRFHLRKHGEFHGEFTISCGWMLSWMLFLNFNLRNAKNGFGSVEGCLLHSGIRYNPFQESINSAGFRWVGFCIGYNHFRCSSYGRSIGGSAGEGTPGPFGFPHCFPEAPPRQANFWALALHGLATTILISEYMILGFWILTIKDDI